ncbi:MAG TPA: biotin--[acetyl-CoA-carboxylase] ligase [Steroidobacteraceae bacterium]|nr:biotin--[acetyl-CoA-carboxylase] ligase [Steroidobacteraceae bacterium]
MISFPAQLLQRLASLRAIEDGTPRYMSGAALAAELNVTRSAIWKAAQRLRELGTEIEAVTRRGYRLALPSSPLATEGVLARLRPATRTRLRDGQCVAETESTSSALLARAPPPPGNFDFLTAEHQRAGRGRRGRSWLGAPGGAVCLSWSWCYAAHAAQLSALSLAMGVAALRALATFGITAAQLKWPNDLVSASGKLGGILIEMRSEAAGPVHVVVGLGLNVALGQQARARIGELGNAATDLAELAGAARLPGREQLVAALLDEGVAALAEFGRGGLAGFLADYRAADALDGRTVEILDGAGPARGTARGIDDDGALRVEHRGRIHRIIAGEVSVRGT